MFYKEIPGTISKSRCARARYPSHKELVQCEVNAGAGIPESNLSTEKVRGVGEGAGWYRSKPLPYNARTSTAASLQMHRHEEWMSETTLGAAENGTAIASSHQAPET